MFLLQYQDNFLVVDILSCLGCSVAKTEACHTRAVRGTWNASSRVMVAFSFVRTDVFEAPSAPWMCVGLADGCALRVSFIKWMYSMLGNHALVLVPVTSPQLCEKPFSFF